MIIDAECDGLCLVYSLEDNAIETKNIGGARTQTIQDRYMNVLNKFSVKVSLVL